jgi:hypothetical protein
MLGGHRCAGGIARIAEDHGARARRERRGDVVPGEAVRLLIRQRRFDRNGTRRLDLHLMIREVRCRQNDLISRVHERRQHRGEGMIRAGGNDEILEAAGNPELSQSFGEQ